METVPSPKVSIGTITHNRPRLLELLAGCVIAQAYPPERLEWVVIDDSSSGSEPDLSTVGQAGIALVYRRLEQRLPIGAKRNLCQELASGELLVLMDDDDYYPPTRVAEAVRAFADPEAEVAGCLRLPLLLLPEGSRWLTPRFRSIDTTANSLAYRLGAAHAHRFDPQAQKAEEASFLASFETPLVPLDPVRTLTCIGHGGNTVDKRLWIARNGQERFERLPEDAAGFPPQDYLARYVVALGLPQSEPASPATLASASEPPGPRTWRVAVITPYHHEPLALLRRCHDSVLAQRVCCTHVLVADGPGRPELAHWDCRHIVLGVGHGDNGNTPRSLGALAAMNEGFDCIAFLDADNWWSQEHLSSAIATQAQGDFDVVFSHRHIVFPDGRRLTQQPEEDRRHRHVDTSCMVLFAPAFRSLALWAQMPRLLAPQCDRVMFSQLMASQRCGWSKATSVFFETWYAGHFLAAGLLPPRNAKFLELQPSAAWEEAAEAFRQRSPTPVYAGGDAVGPDKPRINLVTILGPARSGGTLLQSHLCRYLGFEGIPENQFLYHCVERLGTDVCARHDGKLLRQLLAEPAPPDRRVKAFDARPRGLEQALRVDRSYTLLEAWFRAVQALTPPEAMAFARAHGQLTVLDRSCTLPLVADVLFQCLPEHRAVLMLRDPLEQIASVRRMIRLHPQAWQLSDVSLAQLCEVYLQSLALPLQAAPRGQLRLVSQQRLLSQPQAVVREVCAWLGLAANPFPALEALELPPDHVFNRVHEQAYQAMLEALPQLLVPHEPWKLACLAAEAPDLEALAGPGGILTPGDAEALRRLMAPLQTLIQLHEHGESPLHVPVEQAQPTPQLGLGENLVVLVEQVVEGLLRHGQASCTDRG